ncbi:MAG TPA: glycosyltransferase [Candidatus Polarisedimenticolaceae bacterium]|nr:glycosyltransferase [Candidatus Polarisedimenticolaceae bacterium]
MTRVSVVIPARDEARCIGATVQAVREQAGLAAHEVEILVVDDGSADDTAARAAAAGARVLRRMRGGNPGAARNRGARAARGEILVFLDADCVPEPGWLEAHRRAHGQGALIVGGSLALPSRAGLTARCAHYAGAYHVHAGRHAGQVLNHPPANLSVRRDLFLVTGGFSEQAPVCDGHEELAWQAALLRGGHTIRFEPRARVRHHYRPGLGNLLQRAYRWGYSALESKCGNPAVRWSRLYARPWLLVVAALPLVPLQTLYTLTCWMRGGEPGALALAPLLLLAQASYGAGFVLGGARWLARLPAYAELAPRWR